MSLRSPKILSNGGVLQAGINLHDGGPQDVQGLLLRGVVTATYVTDSPNHPAAGHNPSAVYCDVLCYTAMSGSKFYFLPQCLVTQPVAGIQRGHVWKPRASTFDTTGAPVDVESGTNPANLDGDHVLVGFLDGTANQPVVLRALPHPGSDVGNAALPVGQRLRLTLADGDPDFVKHHGTYYGVTDTGDFRVDTTKATPGTLQPDGSDTVPPQDGSVGNHLYALEKHAKRLVQLMDMSNPQNPSPVLSELLTMTNYVLDFMGLTPVWKVQNGSGNALSVSDVGDNTHMTVGSGTMSVTIAERLQAMYTQLKAKLDAFDAHVHPTPVGPSGPPTPVVAAPAWASNIVSTKVKLPDG